MSMTTDAVNSATTTIRLADVYDHHPVSEEEKGVYHKAIQGAGEMARVVAQTSTHQSGRLAEKVTVAAVEGSVRMAAEQSAAKLGGAALLKFLL
jgi:formiminotetrahydrofolate cyclodeaminase